MRFWRWLIIIIFLSFLALPIWQMKFRYFAELPLHGVEYLSNKVKFSFSEWFSGDLQSNFEKRFSEHFGFRGFLVKVNNQINFSLFTELNNTSASKLVLGKNGFLFEKGYVTNFNKRDAITSLQIKKQLTDLKKLQDELQKRGITLMLLISPSKATIYSEYLPDSWLDYLVKGEKSNYQKAVPLLKESGINYFDGVDYFLQQKTQSPYTLFAKGGTHWNFYSVCQVDSLIVKLIKSKDHLNYSDLTCDPPQVTNIAEGTDKDIADLANLYTNKPFECLIPYPNLQAIPDKGFVKPKVLLVGDSFTWTIMEIFEKSAFFAERDFLYYDRILYSGLGNIGKTEKRDARSMEKLLLAKNWVVLEVNEVGFDNIGYGFVRRALDFLQSDGINQQLK